MTKELKELYKDYKKYDKKEYSTWRNKVGLKTQGSSNIDNLIKECEINFKESKYTKSPPLANVVIMIITMIISLLTIIVSLYINTNGIAVNTYQEISNNDSERENNDNLNKDINGYYIDLVENNISIFKILLSNGLIFVLVVLPSAVLIMEEILAINKTKKMVFYEELKEIL